MLSLMLFFGLLNIQMILTLAKELCYLLRLFSITNGFFFFNFIKNKSGVQISGLDAER